MKRRAVVLREQAIDDLAHLRDYIAEQAGNLTTAERNIEPVLARCERISTAPFPGRHRDDLGFGMRMVVFERSLVILYVVLEAKVEIVSVLSGRRDYAVLATRRLGGAEES